MAITLDATIGGTASNAYVTLARAAVLLEQLPHANDWFTDVTIRKSQLIVHATRRIDQTMRFKGLKTSDAQALAWPRTGVTDIQTGDLISESIIPEFIEWATVEWAFHLYEQANANVQFSVSLRSIRTPSYSAEFTGARERAMPEVVAELLLPYGDRRPTHMHRLLRA